MSEAQTQTEAQEQVYPARVVEVLDAYRIVINRGTRHRVDNGDEFLLYRLGKEIIDPETGESLGLLEVPKGTGEVVHVQENMATVRSNTFHAPTRRVIRNSSLTFGNEEEIVPSNRLKTFSSPSVGDLIKPV